AEGIEAITVGIAEIGRVEAAAMIARRMFGRTAVLKRDFIEPPDLFRIFSLQRRSSASTRFKLAQRHAEARLPPGDHAVALGRPAEADFACDDVINPLRPR